MLCYSFSRLAQTCRFDGLRFPEGTGLRRARGFYSGHQGHSLREITDAQQPASAPAGGGHAGQRSPQRHSAKAPPPPCQI